MMRSILEVFLRFSDSTGSVNRMGYLGTAVGVGDSLKTLVYQIILLQIVDPQLPILSAHNLYCRIDLCLSGWFKAYFRDCTSHKINRAGSVGFVERLKCRTVQLSSIRIGSNSRG